MKKTMIVAMAFAAGVAAFPMAARAVVTSTTVPAGTTNPSHIPGEINFQGLLRDPASGNVYTNGIYTIDFKLFDNITGTGTPLWAEQYSVYVRDGYFNVMLGSKGNSSNGDAGGLEATYKGDRLWKALWFNGKNKEMWLQLTPHEDKDHNGLNPDQIKPISPLQKLLPTPFAFRAMSAEYAEKARGTFSVGSDLTVNGKLTVKGGSSGLDLTHITTGKDELTLGTDVTSPNKVTIQGGNIVAEATTSTTVNPGSSGITFNLKKPATNFKVEGGTISFSPTMNYLISLNRNSVFGVGNGITMISGQYFQLQESGVVSLKSTGGDAHLLAPSGEVTLESAKGELKMESNGNVSLGAKETSASDASYLSLVYGHATVKAGSGDVALKAGQDVRLDGKNIIGKGTVKWNANGVRSPFCICKVEITTSKSDKSNGTRILTTTDVGNEPMLYNWVVVGCRPKNNEDFDCNATIELEGGSWKVYGHGHSNDTMVIHLLGILKEFTYDNR